jgi:GT2 family glycosyltransferase
MIESVLKQTYAHWEICIADASVENSGIRDALRTYSEQDNRIKVSLLKKNGGIASNSNNALTLATGDFIALLDHDDTLAPNALFEVVSVLNEKPETDLIYFDEDKLSANGKIRRNPWFKPDWSPELLLSVNYLMHSVIRRQLVTEAGGFISSTDGAQDWDLIFRCIERTENIEHIPMILYHWREMKGSVAADQFAKPWVFDRQLRAIETHLSRIGINGVEAKYRRPGMVHVRWPAFGAKVSIIIPTRDNVEYLRKCISSILKYTEYRNFEIIIVDNESEEVDTLAYYGVLDKFLNIRITSFVGEFNYSAANNFGAAIAVGEALLFLNDDVEILDPGWLEEMLCWIEREEIGIVGAKLLYPDGSIQHAGVIVGMQGHASHVFMGTGEHYSGPFGSVDWYRDYSAVTGACMMIRKDVFERAGRFDENYQLVFSDIELCVRVRKQGYRILYNPFVRIRHYEGQSRGKHIPTRDIELGYVHLQDLVETYDPYYNRNLTSASCIPTTITLEEIPRLQRLEEIVAHHTQNSQQQ